MQQCITNISTLINICLMQNEYKLENEQNIIYVMIIQKHRKIQYFQNNSRKEQT
jgi:hypothetical protein